MQVGAHISPDGVERLRQRVIEALLGSGAQMIRTREPIECLNTAIAKRGYFLVVDDVWRGRDGRPGHLEELFGGGFREVLRTGAFKRHGCAHSMVLLAKSVSVQLSINAKLDYAQLLQVAGTTVAFL